MTHYTPKFISGVYHYIDDTFTLTHPGDYVNANVYEHENYDDVYNSSYGTDIEIYVHSYGGGSISFDLQGSTKVSLPINSFGWFTIDGRKLPGLWMVSYSGTRSNPNAGKFNGEYLTRVVWDGDYSAIRKVDSPFGTIDGVKAPDYYTSVRPYFDSVDSHGSVDITNSFYLVALTGDADNTNRYSDGADSFNEVEYTELLETTGNIRESDVSKIFEKAVAVTFERYSGKLGENSIGNGNRNFVGIIAVTHDCSADLNACLPVRKFFEPADYADNELNLNFSDGDSFSVKTSEISTGVTAAIDKFRTFNSTGSNNAGYSNLILQGKTVKKFMPTLITFSTFDGLISYAKKEGMQYIYDNNWLKKGNDYIIPDFSDYVDLQTLIGVNVATNKGELYKKAASLVQNDSELTSALGWLHNVFNFILELTTLWESSSLMKIINSYKAIGKVVDDTIGEIYNVTSDVNAPLISKLKLEAYRANRLTAAGNTSPVGQLPYDSTPENWADSVASGSFGFDSFKSIPQRIVITLSLHEERFNKWGGSDRQQQNSTSFYVNKDANMGADVAVNVPMVSGCTYHCLPGHVFRLTGNGKEPLTSFKYY